MKVLLALVLAVAGVHAGPSIDLSEGEWRSFKLEHGKKYSSDVEENFRMKIYKENKLKIEEHNQRHQRGLETFHMKLNQFADMLHHEFKEIMLPYNMNATIEKGAEIYVSPADLSAPGHLDWRESGAVTKVKNQGNCGSCWSFSATGGLEAQNFFKTGKLISLSEQNLVDCSTGYNNHGCDGGMMDRAYQYIQDNGGIDTESSYPYEGVQNWCRFNPGAVGAQVAGCRYVEQGDEDQLMAAAASVGPITIAMDASQESFMYYSDGVYYDHGCSAENLNHAMLVVGYGSDGGEDYWLVKNSWGTGWGDRGYVKMARNRGNHCGVASYPSYPVV